MTIAYTSTRKPAFILAAVLVMLGIMLFLTGAVLATSEIETKISRSQLNGGVAQQRAAGCLAFAFQRLNIDTGVGGWRQNFQGWFADLRATPTSTAVYEVTDTYLSGSCTVRVCTTGTVPDPTNTCTPYGLPNGSVLVQTLATNTLNGTTSRRRAVAKVQLNDPVIPYSGLSSYAGGTMTFQGSGPGDALKTFTGANIQASDVVITGNSYISIPGDNLQASGAITGTSTRATVGGYSATNYPPAATVPTVYTYPFSDVAAAATYTLTPAEFQCLYASTATIPNSACPSWTHSQRGAGCNTVQTVNLPEGNYYITSSLDMSTNCYRRSTTNLTGSLLVSGTFTIAGSGTNTVTLNVNSRSDDTSGIMATSAISFGTASIVDIEGMLYSGGNVSFGNNSVVTIDGGIFTPAGSMTFAPTAETTVDYDSDIVSANFGPSTSYYPPIRQQYWEDEY